MRKMLKNTKIKLQPINWSRAVLGSIVLATKVWDDHAVWTSDFCQIFPDIDVRNLYYSLIQQPTGTILSLRIRLGHFGEAIELCTSLLSSKRKC
jgi:hypothetical protein